MMVNRLRFVVFASLCTSLSSFVPQPLEPSLMRLHMVSTSVPSPASSSASSSSSPSSSSLPLSDQHLPKPKEIMELLSSRYTEATYDSWAKTRNYVYRTNKNRLSHFQIQEVLRFLDNIFPQDDELVLTILQSSPRILRKNVNNNLFPTAEFLKNLYGPVLFREAVSRNPDLLLTEGVGYDSEGQGLESYLSDELCMSESSVKRVKGSSPFLFQLPLSKVQAVVSYLRGLLSEGGFGADDCNRILGKIVLAHPSLMHLSVETNLQPRLNFLRTACQLDDKDMATLIKASSGILGLSVEDNLKPTLEFLTDLLQTPDPLTNVQQLLRKCIKSHPNILALSLQNLASKVEYFNSLGGGSTAAEVSLASRIAMRAPVVFSLSLQDNIVPTVEFLAKVWGLTSGEVLLSHWLGESPAVLTLSLEGNIQPTMDFYNRTGYTQLGNDWILKEGGRVIRGRYIAASLFNRLLPRWHYLLQQQEKQQQQQQQREVPLEEEEEETTLDMPPIYILVGASDDSFCEVYGFDQLDYSRFRSESAPRLKFSSQFDTWLKTGRAIEV